MPLQDIINSFTQEPQEGRDPLGYLRGLIAMDLGATGLMAGVRRLGRMGGGAYDPAAGDDRAILKQLLKQTGLHTPPRTRRAYDRMRDWLRFDAAANDRAKIVRYGPVLKSYENAAEALDVPEGGNPLQRFRRWMAENSKVGPHYNHLTDTVGLDKVNGRRSLPTNGVLAHELGHARQSKGLLAGYGLSKGLLGASSLGSFLVQDKDSGRNNAIAGSVASLPMLYTEFDASRRGAGLLSSAARAAGKKLPIAKRLSPFVGFPTYMFAAAQPAIVHGLRSHYGAYNE